jgi:hypothetical protein
MLSVEQCKRYIPKGKYTDEQIEQIRDSLYQLTEILVDSYLKNKEKGKKCQES